MESNNFVRIGSLDKFIIRLVASIYLFISIHCPPETIDPSKYYSCFFITQLQSIFEIHVCKPTSVFPFPIKSLFIDKKTDMA